MQMGVISPTKLRMKLLGARGGRKDEGGRNSSRASPTKHEDSKNAMNSLLSQDLEEEGNSAVQTTAAPEVSGLEGSGNQASKKDLLLKDKFESIRARNHNFGKSASYQSQPVGNLSTVHPVRSQEEDCNGDDSGHENGSTSSFEFHRGERTSQLKISSSSVLMASYNDEYSQINISTKEKDKLVAEVIRYMLSITSMSLSVNTSPASHTCRENCIYFAGQDPMIVVFSMEDNKISFLTDVLWPFKCWLTPSLCY